MFDSDTEAIIRQAPSLKGLDLARLPEDLTELYTEISSLRLTLAEGRAQEESNLEKRLERLSRLAHTYALFVACRVENDKTRSCAFVAGQAFRLLGQAQIALGELSFLQHRQAHGQCSDWLSAILLFLIAGSPTDALATVRLMTRLGPDDNESPDHFLIRAVSEMAVADLDAATAAGNAAADQMRGGNYRDRVTFDGARVAEELLYLRLAEGVGLLARSLLYFSARSDAGEAADIFGQVRNLAIQDFSEVDTHISGHHLSSYSGPYFASLLLLRLADELPNWSVLQIPPPRGTPNERWLDFLQFLARKRPFLWPNHNEALASRFLDTPSSVVMTLPTGAGKTSLATLKIATQLLQDKKVVYLAPTHALCAQITRELRDIFNDKDVRESIVDFGGYTEVGEEGASTLADLTVMTPERCLFLVDLYPCAFAEVGLIVLDECHLLHPSRGVEDRRALDTMMCLLQVMYRSEDLDVVLMSAMVANGDELSSWLRDTLKRPCSNLQPLWKPTRQAKGCLVFDKSEFGPLDDTVRRARRKRTTIGPPASLKRELKATPYGLFCLHRCWDTLNVRDYHLARLSKSTLTLETNHWQITNNMNASSAQLAAQAASSGMRVIVFSQNKTWCESIQKRASELVATQLQLDLTPEEEALREAAIEEAGGLEHAYLPSENGVVIHHGLLNTVERELAEGLFRRDEGARIIVASPTLAQGMNLPAEMVILAGESRFDQTSNSQALLQAHELLNAAGRAGRAGHHPEGLVLLVPSKPIVFDRSKNSISNAWMELQNSIFAKVDQSLTVDDPLEYLLDKIQNADSETPRLVKYLLHRLPVEDAEGTSAAEGTLRRSFAWYRSRTSGAESALAASVDTLLSLRKAALELHPEPSWMNHVAAANGLPTEVIYRLLVALRATEVDPDWALSDWVDWLFAWFRHERKLSTEILRAPWLESLFPSDFPVCKDGMIACECIDSLCELTQLWIRGCTLREIQARVPYKDRGTNDFVPTPTAVLKKCTKAREFSQRVSVDIAYAFGLLPQVWRELVREDPGTVSHIPLVVAVGGTCIRRGVPSPAVLALLLIAGEHTPTKGIVTRRQAIALYNSIEDYLSPGSFDDSFHETLSSVGRALSLSQLGEGDYPF